MFLFLEDDAKTFAWLHQPPYKSTTAKVLLVSSIDSFSQSQLCGLQTRAYIVYGGTQASCLGRTPTHRVFTGALRPLFVRSRSSLSAEVLMASDQPERMTPMPPLSRVRLMFSSAPLRILMQCNLNSVFPDSVYYYPSEASCTIDDSVFSPTQAVSPHLTATSRDQCILWDSFQLLLKPIDWIFQRRFRLQRVPSNSCSKITNEVSL